MMLINLKLSTFTLFSFISKLIGGILYLRICLYVVNSMYLYLYLYPYSSIYLYIQSTYFDKCRVMYIYHSRFIKKFHHSKIPQCSIYSFFLPLSKNSQQPHLLLFLPESSILKSYRISFCSLFRLIFFHFEIYIFFMVECSYVFLLSFFD